MRSAGESGSRFDVLHMPEPATLVLLGAPVVVACRAQRRSRT
jgi:hypothetical protein